MRSRLSVHTIWIAAAAFVVTLLAAAPAVLHDDGRALESLPPPLAATAAVGKVVASALGLAGPEGEADAAAAPQGDEASTAAAPPAPTIPSTAASPSPTGAGPPGSGAASDDTPPAGPKKPAGAPDGARPGAPAGDGGPKPDAPEAETPPTGGGKAPPWSRGRHEKPGIDKPDGPGSKPWKPGPPRQGERDWRKPWSRSPEPSRPGRSWGRSGRQGKETRSWRPERQSTERRSWGRSGRRGADARGRSGAKSWKSSSRHGRS